MKDSYVAISPQKQCWAVHNDQTFRIIKASSDAMRRGGTGTRNDHRLHREKRWYLYWNEMKLNEVACHSANKKALSGEWMLQDRITFKWPRWHGNNQTVSDKDTDEPLSSSESVYHNMDFIYNKPQTAMLLTGENVIRRPTEQGIYVIKNNFHCSSVTFRKTVRFKKKCCDT